MVARSFVVFAVLMTLPAFPPSLAQGRGIGAGDGPNRAGLVVRHGDGRLVTACVSFSEPTITGEELLHRAGLDVAVQAFGYGGAICAIDGEGCQPPGEACFCRCQTAGETCTYWAYSHLGEDGQWHGAGSAASAHTIRDGDVDGWSWGGEGPLPSLSFADVCTAPAAATVMPTVMAPTVASAIVMPLPTPTSARMTPVPQGDGETVPSWSAYASFALLGLLLVGAFGWLLRRRG
jgi:hypothetical protein